MNWMDVVFCVSVIVTVVGGCFIIFFQIQMWWLLKHWSDRAPEPWWIRGKRK